MLDNILRVRDERSARHPRARQLTNAARYGTHLLQSPATTSTNQPSSFSPMSTMISSVSSMSRMDESVDTSACADSRRSFRVQALLVASRTRADKSHTSRDSMSGETTATPAAAGEVAARRLKSTISSVISRRDSMQLSAMLRYESKTEVPWTWVEVRMSSSWPARPCKGVRSSCEICGESVSQHDKHPCQVNGTNLRDEGPAHS